MLRLKSVLIWEDLTQTKRADEDEELLIMPNLRSRSVMEEWLE